MIENVGLDRFIGCKNLCGKKSQPEDDLIFPRKQLRRVLSRSDMHQRLPYSVNLEL